MTYKVFTIDTVQRIRKKKTTQKLDREKRIDVIKKDVAIYIESNYQFI